MLKTTNQNTEYNGEGKPKKSTKTVKSTESADGLTSEQTQMLSDFKNQLDSLFKMPNYSFQNLASKIEIYPNPNDGNFNISFNLTNIDNVDLVIIDVMGKVVFSQKHIVGFYTLPINLSGLSQGVYLARFENSNGEISARKITID